MRPAASRLAVRNSTNALWRADPSVFPKVTQLQFEWAFEIIWISDYLKSRYFAAYGEEWGKPPGVQLEMHFTFEVEEDEATAIVGTDTYRLQLADGVGQSIMTLRLPAELIEPVVASKLEHTISMALDGTIAMTTDGSSADGSSHDASSIETLVADAVGPSMLDDEPAAQQMLRMLRDRLRQALGAVDAAIARMEDDP